MRSRLALLTLAIPTSLAAQLDVRLDAGAARLSQRSLPVRSAMTSALTVQDAGRAWSVWSSALAARSDSDATAQGVGVATVFMPVGNRLRIEGGVVGAAFGASRALPVTAASGTARGQLLAGNAWIEAGGSRGRVWRMGSSAPLTTISAGAGWRRDALTLAAGASAVRADTRYRDASLIARLSRARWELGAAAGARHTSDVSPGDATWGEVDAAWWLSPRVALAASGGRALEDATRGVPSTRYATVAVRVALRSRAWSHAATRERPALSIEMHGEQQLLTVSAAGAQRVELMADFTGWEPVELTQTGASFSMTLARVAAGSHHVAIRVDGGAWLVPANLSPADDDFGGRVGLLSVP
ncbi:MAG: hypothetical protein JWO05_61 [Gemmatimonadetes bacterium]|nr:hypothetical protein [Gemmatimonadota bacterium]